MDRRNTGFFRMFVTALLTSVGMAIVLFFILSGYLTRTQAPQRSAAPVPGSEANQAPAPQQISVENIINPTIPAIVARSATPGVVGIAVLKVDGHSIFDRNTAEKWGIGSGVIVNPNGYILTNHHVAGGKNRRIIVSTAEKGNFDGQTLWSDPVLDLAVVKVDAVGLPTIPLGDAAVLQVGEPAIAIGNPLGLQFQRTVTSGIISALNRTIKIDTELGPNFMEDLIQTDASINPGNSGGPLLNSRGQVVGINTIKVATAEAIGFAIPINIAKPIVQSFVTKGTFNEPYLGVFAYDREVIPYLDSNLRLQRGVYIANIDEGGPAFAGGLRLGDVITQVDGMDVNTMMDLRTYIYSKNIGDTIAATRVRSGDASTVTVRLAVKARDGLITR